jgi:hypothetical protein
MGGLDAHTSTARNGAPVSKIGNLATILQGPCHRQNNPWHRQRSTLRTPPRALARFGEEDRLLEAEVARHRPAHSGTVCRIHGWPRRYRNPKRKRGNVFRPRLRFGLRCGKPNCTTTASQGSLTLAAPFVSLPSSLHPKNRYGLRRGQESVFGPVSEAAKLPKRRNFCEFRYI